MPLDEDQKLVARLAAILRAAEKPVMLERLVGRLLGNVLEVPFRFARPGEQPGSDGGTRGPGPRAIKYEARRYKETTRLDERGIRGEIEQAVEDNPDLEAWVLATTKEVSEQTHTVIANKGTREGVAAVVIDWSPQPLPRLAALCAYDPDGFEAEFGSGHRNLLAGVAAMEGYEETLKGVTRDLESWSIGYELVRRASHARLDEIWRSRTAARTHFGQDVAGGSADVRHVRRAVVVESLDAWQGGKAVDCPALVVGQEGMGKTWSVLDWLQARCDELPIIVLVPRHRTPGELLAAEGATDLGAAGAGRTSLPRLF